MTPEEKDLITGLFQRLQSSDTPSKDPEAAQLIQRLTSAQISAPYLLVQTVLVQEHALQNAQARIAQLERQIAGAGAASQPSGGSFLSGLLHPRSAAPAPAVASAPPPLPQAPLPYPSTVGMPPSAAGGFLRGALSTAAGVAGGALLFQGIENLLGHHAGPFGSALGSGGGSFIDQPLTENVEVTNNYYENDGAARRDSSFLPDENSGSQTIVDDSTDANPDLTADDDTFADGGDGGGDSFA